MTALPNFLLIGGTRCGTTSFYHYLRQHPDVFMPDNKEPGYFVWAGGPTPKYVRDATTRFSEYTALFEGAKEKAIGEASATYLYRADETVDRIAARLPDVKLIAVLRDPVARAFSQYRMSVRAGAETLATFREALAAEERRVREQDHLILHYVRQSLYFPALSRFTERFGQDRLLVFTFDEFVNQPDTTIRRAFRFLGVDPTFRPDMSRIHNSTRLRPVGLRRRIRRIGGRESGDKNNGRGRLAAAEARLDPGLRRDLLERFLPDIEATSELLGRDLSHWVRQRSSLSAPGY